LFAALEKQARHLLDEQRDAARALADALYHLRWQRALVREFGDQAPNLRIIERRQRNDTMVRPQAPGRPEFRARRRQNQEGRLRAAIAERAHEIDRRRVEPLQILKDENKWLHSRAGYRPSDHRRQLPAMNLIRRKVWPAFRWNRNVDERREQRHMLRGVELDLREDRFELGEPSLRRNLGTSKPSPSPAYDRMQRRILQQLRRTPFDP